jgi:hypothetical protein
VKLKFCMKPDGSGRACAGLVLRTNGSDRKVGDVHVPGHIKLPRCRLCGELYLTDQDIQDMKAGWPASKAELEIDMQVMKDAVVPHKVPRIVAALQSPTLLNNLAQIKDTWSIEVVDLTDARDAFKEASLLRLPTYDGNPEGVAMFWGCDEKHLRWASHHLPDVPQAFLAHSGLPEFIGPSANGRLVVGFLRDNLAAALRAFNPAGIHYVSPAYEARPRWSWRHARAWTMMSRPSARYAPTLASFRKLIQLTNEAVGAQSSDQWHRLHGEGQPYGFLDGEAREDLIVGSSCYLSFEQPWGGFGLAEHEAMAAGVPLCAKSWGDMPEEARCHPGIGDTEQQVATAAARCLRDAVFAREVSEAGLEYIRKHRTMAALERTARGLLSR